MKESRILNVSPKVYNGIHYRSTLEADTARNLDKLGIPFSYEKKKVRLLEGFRCPYQHDKVQAITYTPDFEIGSSIILECKGFETPEWKLKKKYIYKYLMENEPDVCYYVIKDSRKSLLEVLDNHWAYLGYAVQVSPKPIKIKKGKKPEHPKPKLYDSVDIAMQELGITNKSKGLIMKCMIGNAKYAYGYNWKLMKLKI